MSNFFPCLLASPWLPLLAWSLAGLLAHPSLAQAPAASFSLQANSPATGSMGSYPFYVGLADVNGDGKLDALALNADGSPGGRNTLGVLLGNGQGGFLLQANSASTDIGTQPRSLVVADVNGDGKPDALTTIFGKNALQVLLGDGQGNFTRQIALPSTGYGTGPFILAVGDVNGDGKLDALTANNNGTVSVLLGNGLGGFLLKDTFSVKGYPYNVVLADVNGDGKLDALTPNYYSSTLGVLLGDGQGGFTLQPNAPSTGYKSYPNDLQVADVNDDGRLDALTSNDEGHTVGVLLGDGRGGFTLQPDSPPTFLQPNSIAVADVNGDGKLDALTGHAGTLSVLLGNGQGGFALQPTAFYTSGPFGLAVGDVNSDGKPDVLTANRLGGCVNVLLNTTTTTLLATRPTLPGTKASLFPNPASSSVSLTATGLPTQARNLEATLLNSLGQPVRHLTLPATLGVAQNSVSIAELAPGLYLLHLHVRDAQGTELGTLPLQHLSVTH